MHANRTVILINAQARKIGYGELPDVETLAYLQQFVRGYIDVVSICPGLDLIINDEGMCQTPQDFFTFDGVGQELFAGNGIVAGVDEDGNTIGTTVPLDTVKRAVRFMDAQTVALIMQVRKGE